MRILFLNTYKNYGGAAVAVRRLIFALKNKVQTEFRFQYRDKNVKKLRFFFPLLALMAEKISLKRQLRFRKDLYSFSIPFFSFTCVSDLLKNKPDIIHIHWVNLGFLNLRKLRKLQHSNIPLVWTLHDMWAFTGGCHYAASCKQYEAQCGNCPIIRDAHSKDISNKIFRNKIKTIDFSSITFVCCSDWLRDCALRSTLLKNSEIVSIPNPIDCNEFKPLPKEGLREKYGLKAEKNICYLVLQI